MNINKKTLKYIPTQCTPGTHHPTVLAVRQLSRINPVTGRTECNTEHGNGSPSGRVVHYIQYNIQIRQKQIFKRKPKFHYLLFNYLLIHKAMRRQRFIDDVLIKYENKNKRGCSLHRRASRSANRGGYKLQPSS